jgi:outer membrane biosynthesis protein TonB
VTTAFLDLDEFASEQKGPVRVSDVLARGIPIRWDEAVALLQEIVETITAGGGDEAPVPAFEDVLLDEQGGVRVSSARRGERGPVAAGRALHALLATADVPLPLRLFVTQANAPETHKTLKAFADALAYFGRPGRAELIRGICERYRSSAQAASTAPAPGRPATPPPLPPNHARGDQVLEQRRTAPQWLMPAAVAVCVASLAAVIWFGVLGGGASSAATSAVAEATDATAEATPTSKDTSTSQTNAKRPGPKGTVAQREPAPTTRARPQSTPGDRAPRRDVARESSPPLFDPSAARATEALEAQARETTKATVPLIPASREYVIAPRENEATTIYSAADADVQPPVMMYPSLPPTVFVARNADVTVVNRMELVIAPDGTVERVRLVNGPQRMPDMMLLSGAKLWKFSPATRNGEAVRYRTTVTWSGFP